MNYPLDKENGRATSLLSDEHLSHFMVTPQSADSELDKKRAPMHKTSANWLFNRLQSPSGMLLIDTRAPVTYTSGYIQSAINIPKPSTSDITLTQLEEQLESEMARHQFQRRKLLELIVYSEPHDIEAKVDEWTHKLCMLLAEEGVVSVVRFLAVPYSIFAERYPFMIHQTSHELGKPRLNRTNSGNHQVSYPNEIIEDFLYMGNLWQATNANVIEQLNITHVVNATLDCGNIFESKGLQYFNVSIKDKEDQNIAVFLEDCTKFIEKAKQQNTQARVLVHCTQGVSRSAALVIYYLMRVNGWTLSEAHAFLLQRRGVIFPNHAFTKQLLDKERELYKFNSVEEIEVDFLLRGLLPVRTFKDMTTASKAGFCANQCTVM